MDPSQARAMASGFLLATMVSTLTAFGGARGFDLRQGTKKKDFIKLYMPLLNLKKKDRKTL